MTTNKIINIKHMCELVNRDRRTLWVWVRDGKFPQPIKMDGRTIGWPESVYQKWVNNQIMETQK